jgi:trans-2-enoyl-CoA reductase
MKRILVTRIGEPREALEVQEVPDLSPGPGEVLLQMLAIPIHPADLLVMRGRHVFEATYPIGTGIEGAGRVIAHGEGVSEPPLGQRVALPFGGTWAEQVTIPARSVIPLPDDIELHQGAMLALNPVTALGLIRGMNAGDWLLHNAANSSLARLITRVAAHQGIRSISVVRRPGMEDELKANGADHVMVDGDDLAQRVRRYLGGRGVDRALDAVAGAAAGRLFDAVNDFGTLTCYGLLGSNDIVFNAAQFVFRDVRVQGYSRLRYLRSLSEPDADALYADLFDCQKKGLFHTPILKTFAFEDICEAVELAESSGGKGKVLLIPEGGSI